MAAALVIALRLVVPLSILRWPLGGGIVAMLIDAIDVVLVDTLAALLGEPPEFGPAYAQMDTWRDTCYLGLEVLPVRRWPEVLTHRAALLLFGWRLARVVLFEATAARELLVVFPNLFENLYLYVLVRMTELRWTTRRSRAA